MVIVTLTACLSCVIVRHNHEGMDPGTCGQSVATEREAALGVQLTQRGQEFLSALGYPSGRVVVSVRCATGLRKQNWQLFPCDKTRFGYVATGIQEKSEKCGKGESERKAGAKATQDRSMDYSQAIRSEKRDYSRLQQNNQEDTWIERIGACAVIDGKLSTSAVNEVQEALGAALGIDTCRGDTVKVILVHRD